jgi:hypothetical protein
MTEDLPARLTSEKRPGSLRGCPRQRYGGGLDDTGTRGSSRVSHGPTLLVVLALGLPFIGGVLATNGLTEGFHTFHDTDEAAYHYPTILVFSRDLPHPDLASYRSATLPLYNLVMATAHRAFHLSLPGLRALHADGRGRALTPRWPGRRSRREGRGAACHQAPAAPAR